MALAHWIGKIKRIPWPIQINSSCPHLYLPCSSLLRSPSVRTPGFSSYPVPAPCDWMWLKTSTMLQASFYTSTHWPHSWPLLLVLHLPLFSTRVGYLRPSAWSGLPPGFVWAYKLRTLFIFFSVFFFLNQKNKNISWHENYIKFTFY